MTDREQAVVTSDHIMSIYRDIGSDWKILGLTLRLSTPDIGIIGTDSYSASERSYEVLQKWRKSNGNEAKVGELAKALEKIGNKKAADKLLGM